MHYKCVLSKILKWGLKGFFQLMQILGLLGIYIDAAVVFIMKFATSKSLWISGALSNFYGIKVIVYKWRVEQFLWNRI
jgi:hypothetical protein